MKTEFTPAVARALSSARGWAGRSDAGEVLSVHLLLALIEDDEGLAATSLVRAGLDLPALQKHLPPGANASPTSLDSVPASSRLDTIVIEATRRANALLVERSLDSELLLHTLLELEPDLLEVLEQFGLSRERFEPPEEPALPLPLDEPIHELEVTALVDADRILDAAANRAREALRVVEDYCRFVLDDAFLSGQLKSLRHDLTEVLGTLPVGRLLEARETLRDVGTTVTTATEYERQSLLDVVQANCKRLQEALRTLEEFGKLHGPDLGRVVESLRYRSYTLEKAIVLGSFARSKLANARLYVLLSGAQCLAALDWTINEAAAGGADLFQLREKGLTDRELLERARNVRRWTRQAGALFIMNDRPDLARLVEADGVHLGQDDLPVKEARRILGPDALIGVSTHSLAQTRQAVLDGASYIGVGPTFPSETKSFSEFPGLDLVRDVSRETSLPAFVIGGINRGTITQAVAAGATRVAVSQAVCQAEEPRHAAAELRRQIGA